MVGIRRPSLSTCRARTASRSSRSWSPRSILLTGIMGVLGHRRPGRRRQHLQPRARTGRRASARDHRGSPVDPVRPAGADHDRAARSGDSRGWPTRRSAERLDDRAAQHQLHGRGRHLLGRRLQRRHGPARDRRLLPGRHGSTTPAQCLPYLGRTGSIAGNGTAAARRRATAASTPTSTAPSTASSTPRAARARTAPAPTATPTTTSGSSCSCAGTRPRHALRAAVRDGPEPRAVGRAGRHRAHAGQTTVGPNTRPGARLHGDDQLPAGGCAWYVDGTAKGQATGSLTTWNFTWHLGARQHDQHDAETRRGPRRHIPRLGQGRSTSTARRAPRRPRP